MNRSARIEAQKVRGLLEAWFSRYPPEARTELRQRFRSKGDTGFRSAFFELFLHELLLQLGCRAEIHPRLPATSKQPDFKIQSRNGNFAYLEAKVVTGESREETAARARVNVVYDVLDNIASPNFFLGVDLRHLPRTPPQAKDIRNFLEDHLTTTDPNDVEQAFAAQGFHGLPRWIYEHDGGAFEFYPVPKRAEARGTETTRPLGIFTEAGWSSARQSIRAGVVTKSRRYGRLNLPYVVAINALEPGVDREDAIQALFGSEQWNLDRTTLEVQRVTRALDGAWTSPNGPRYTRTSAVLLVRRLAPWSVSRAGICLYHNPWAERPYDSELNRLPHTSVREGQVTWHDGTSLAEIFDLPLDWPED